MSFFDFWKKWRTKKKVPLRFPDWESYSYQDEEGHPIFVSFDWSSAQEQTHTEYPFCQRVIVLLDPQKSSEEGLPLQTEESAIQQLETSLLQALHKQDVACRYVAKLMYRGVIEFVFQTDINSAFEKVLALWKTDHKQNQIELQGKEGWSFFDKKICPPSSTLRQIKDQRQIQKTQQEAQSIGMMNDREQTYVFLHSFTGMDQMLKNLAHDLDEQGFSSTLQQEHVVSLLKIQQLGLLEISEITQYSHFFDEVSTQYGVTYTGWEAKPFQAENSFAA